MTHAYQEIYLSKAQSILGDAFDYAINICIIPGDSFVKLFVASTISRRMENGEPDYLAGKSGIEVAMDILVETTGKAPEALPQDHYGRSREYWIGWAVAYISGFPAEGTATSSRQLPLKTCRRCTTPSTKRTLQNLQVLWMPGCGSSLPTPI